MQTLYFKIPDRNIDHLKSKFDKLYKKSFKLGLSLPKFFVSSTENKIYKDEHGREQVAKVHNVIVEYNDLKINGWEFVASISYLPEGNIIRNSSMNEVPEKYRNSGSICEHCNINRKRNETYIIKNEETGDWRQVGKTCLNDFIGGISPVKYADLSQIIADAISSAKIAEEEIYEGGTNSDTLSLYQYLAHVGDVINTHGWVSKKQSKVTGEEPTAEIAFREMTVHSDYYKEPTAQSYELAASAIEWTEAIEGEEISEYLHNIRTIARSGVVEKPFIGYAASIVSAYKISAKDKVKEERRDRVSNHIGTIGKRDIFELRVNKIITCSTKFGYSYLNSMEDKDGNVVIWFSSQNVLEEGKEYFVKGTVKEHKEFKGIKQTILSRCVV